jgi:hypothetical protein
MTTEYVVRERREVHDNPSPGGVIAIAIVRRNKGKGGFTVALKIKRYGDLGNQGQWRCNSLGNGFGVGNTPEAAVQGAYYDGAGGPEWGTLWECRQIVEDALRDDHEDALNERR